MDTGTIIALATLGLTCAGALVTGVLRFGKVEAAAEVARQALAKADASDAALSQFKVEVARDYATADMVASVEGRVVTAIDRLGDRIDRFLEVRSVAPRVSRTTKS